jgi:hypothetical protein
MSGVEKRKSKAKPEPLESSLREKKSYAVYQRWPQDGTGWVHPEDVNTVRRLIPGRRIFRREPDEGRYMVFSYGQREFRVLPTLHLAIDGEGFDIGDRIEVKSQLGRNRPFIGRIREMRWNERHQRIEYFLARREQGVPRWYSADELSCLENKTKLREPG